MKMQDGATFLDEYNKMWETVSDYPSYCLEGNKWELAQISYLIAEVFYSEPDLTSSVGKRLFREILHPLLTASEEETEKMMTLYAEYHLATPETLLPLSYALENPSCPPSYLSLAARHSWWFFRHHAMRNPSCPEDDQVYAALMEGQR